MAASTGTAGARPADVDSTYSPGGTPGVFSASFKAGTFGPDPSESGFEDVAALADGSAVAVGFGSSERPHELQGASPSAHSGLEGPPAALWAKLTPAGELDTSFSGDGYDWSYFGGQDAEASRVVALPDGKLIIAGERTANADRVTTGSFPWVARLTAAGELDSSFGPATTPGFRLLGQQLDPGVGVTGLAVGSDGKVNLAGLGNGGQLIAIRLNADGSPDTGFSGDGIAALTIPGNTGLSVGELALPADTTPLIAGGGSLGPFVVRLDNAGALDVGWSGDGIATIPNFEGDAAGGLLIDGSGRALVGGGACCAFEVARLTTTGAVDTTYSPSPPAGSISMFADGAPIQPTDTALMPGGEVALSGWDIASHGGTGWSLFGRVTALGEPDTGFASGGAAVAFQHFSSPGRVQAHALTPVSSTQLLTVGVESLPEQPTRALIARLGAPGEAPKASLQISRTNSSNKDVYRPGQSITVDASASTDTEGPIAKYAWSFDGGPFEDGAARRTYTLPEIVGDGSRTLSVKVRVSDGDGLTDITSGSVTYIDNQEPNISLHLLQNGQHVSRGGSNNHFIVQAGRETTFNASGSKDPDGSVADFRWDFTGGGALQSLGSQPTFQYTKPGFYTGKLEIVDDEGAAVSTLIPIEVIKKKCDPTQKTLKIGKLLAEASCFADNLEGQGDKAKTIWETPSQAEINGLGVSAPKGIRIIEPKKGDEVTVEADKATVTGDANATVPTPVTLQTNQSLSWKVNTKTGAVSNLKAGAGALMGSLTLVDVPKAEFVSGGLSRLTMKPKLPTEFGARVPDKQPVMQFGEGGVTASALEPFQFEVKDVPMDPIYINKLKIEYRGNGSWLFDGRGELRQPMSIGICGQVEIDRGKFKRAHLEATFVSGQPSCPNDSAGKDGLNVGMDIYIKSIEGDLEFLDPGEKSNCVESGSKVISFADLRSYMIAEGMSEQAAKKLMPDLLVDYGTPSSAFCVQVFFAYGPQVLGARLLEGDLKAGFAAYEEKSDVFFANGRADLLGPVLTRWKGPHELEAGIEIWTNGYMKLRADLSVDFEGVVQVGGFLTFESMLPKGKFNAHGYNEACIIDMFCDGAEVIASHVGVGACRRGTGPDFGGYVKWAHNPGVVPYLVGCDLSDIDVYIDPGDAGPVITPIPARSADSRERRAGSNEVELEVERGRQSLIVGAEGLDALPRVSLLDPDGNVVLSYDGVYELGVEDAPGGKAAVADSEQADVVNLIVEDPKPGKWTFRVDQGSVPVTGLKLTTEEPAAKLDADVIERNGEHYLRYKREVRKGESIRFTETGPSIAGEIGVAKGSEGEIRFEPAPGAKEKREIVAWTTYDDGRPGQRIVLDTYKAPAVPQPQVNGLKAKRKGKKVVASWAKSADADRYEVFFEIADGTTRHTITKKTAAKVKTASKKVGGRVTVTALVDGGVEGKPEAAKIKKKKKKKGKG